MAITWAGPCHLPLSRRLLPLELRQYSTQSPASYSILPGRLCLSKARRKAESLSACTKAFRACSLRSKFSLKRIPSGRVLSARQWLPASASETNEPGRWRLFPKRHCSGVNPCTRLREFLAAKAWRRHWVNSSAVSMGRSFSIRDNMSLTILP